MRATLKPIMPASTGWSGNAARRTAALPTPFCSETTQAPGASTGQTIALPAAAVSALLTQTSTTAQSANDPGIGRKFDLSGFDTLLSPASRRVSTKPPAMSARHRLTSDESRPDCQSPVAGRRHRCRLIRRRKRRCCPLHPWHNFNCVGPRTQVRLRKGACREIAEIWPSRISARFGERYYQLVRTHREPRPGGRT